ncbi:DUF4382 domain-containing protein [Natrinema halophilum]|uniref:DUF4382 domain-containing protein n=1 Tax=Natrinema halophilum TaxID=1699371 RepID=A0A7D5K7E0_9EURY|nr:DUF4382 domain-containing protein [Natrinema halophilum]QLG49903.1 DUF4382 domain-containing protein [Natrinema halophilum]
MNRRAIQLILVAALVAIAGCAGGMGGEPAQSPESDDPQMADDSSGETGTAAFYVSDEPSQIDNFKHLNVTITKVGFKKTGDATDGESDEGDGGNESDENETESDDGTEDGTESADDDESTNETVADETEPDDEDEGKEGNGDDGGEDGKDDGASEEQWVEYDVDERTVDLTELKGANASMIDEFELPAGEYETVFIYVSDTEGILTDGTETNVKLPSNKLQLHTTFTIGNNESVDFVYDIAPHKAGGSEKYILKPVVSQSGTGDDVEIRDVDEKKEANEKRDGNERDTGESDTPDGNGTDNGNAKERPKQD